MRTIEEIEQLRMTNGLTRIALYQRAGHSGEVYRRIVKGITKGNVNTLENLSRALDELIKEKAGASHG